MIKRCNWVNNNPLMIRYHDEEWGVPIHDDRKLFEFMLLDTFQAGLSWEIVLNKREGFRKVFYDFDPNRIANISEKEAEKLMDHSGIIRNKLKIQGTIINAIKFLEIQKEFSSFDKYIWQFTNYKTIKNNYKTWKEIPATSPESNKMSADLKKRGFKFVGSTICYAFMQAVGMVDDHSEECYRRKV